MSYEFYKIVHVFSVFVLFSSIGVLAVAAGTPRGGAIQRAAKIAHGVSLALIFVAGFGLLARLGMFGSIAPWAWAKIGLWIALGLIVIPMRTIPDRRLLWWALAPCLGGLAVWLAVSKPF